MRYFRHWRLQGIQAAVDHGRERPRRGAGTSVITRRRANDDVGDPDADADATPGGRSGVEGDSYVPAEVGCVDLERPLPRHGATAVIDGEQRRQVLLVRIGPKPIGMVELPPPRPGPEEMADGLWRELAAEIQHELRASGRPAVERLDPDGLGLDPNRTTTDDLPSTGTDPTAAVVIATHERPDELDRCLRSLTELTRTPDQIIVVDNAPRLDRTREVVDRWRRDGLGSIEYVREDVPGLAVAHNTGLDRVKTDIVAFTDDDVIVDPYWLQEIVAGFRTEPGVGSVTGLIAPAQLDTWPQQWVESHFGFNKGFERIVFDRDRNRPDDPLFPLTAGRMGSGANMAFTVEALAEIDGFDPALGAGTPARGGDDLAALHRVIQAGRSVVYQPSAVVFHHHRADEAGISDQALGYGMGLTAYLTSAVLADPSLAVRAVRHAPLAVNRAREITAGAGRHRSALTKRLARRQTFGMLRGPFGYLQSRLRRVPEAHRSNGRLRRARRRP